VQIETDPLAGGFDDSIQRMIMDARQQHEFEMMQQTVADPIGKNKYP
jgi:hypothetical protein